MMTVCLLWNRLSLGTLSSEPMSAILGSGTGLYLGKSSDSLSFGGITSPSLETIEPRSSGESFSIDEFLSEVREYCMVVTGVA